MPNNRKGFTLLELLICLAVFFGVFLLGWGLSFAFSLKVFVPWLGVIPVEYHNLAAFISAFIFDGVITGALVLVGAISAAALFGRRRSRR